MESLLLLIPLSALVIVGAVVVFFRAVDGGQFEDLERQGRSDIIRRHNRCNPRPEAAAIKISLRQ